MARERCAPHLLDGQTLDAADGLGLPDRRLCRPRLVVDLRPSPAARRKEKKRRQECTECMGAEVTALEDGERYGI